MNPTHGILVLILFLQLFHQNSSAQELSTSDSLWAGQLFVLKNESVLEARFSKTSGVEVISIPVKNSFITAEIISPKVKSTYGSFHFKNLKPEYSCSSAVIHNLRIVGENHIQVKGLLCSQEFTIDFKTDQKALLLHLNVHSKYNSVSLMVNKFSEEHFLGGGEQFTHVLLDDKKIPFWVEEQGIGRGDQPISFFTKFRKSAGHEFSTSAPIPVLMTSAGRCLLIENKTKSSVDLTNSSLIKFNNWGSQLQLRVWQDVELTGLIEQYTAYSGRLKKLPEWTEGIIVGLQGGTEIVKEKLDKLLRQDVDVSAVWIQDWCGRRQTFFGSQLRWYWETDTKLYPDLKRFCQQMNDKGIKVLGYINPFLTNEGSIFQDAMELGYFLKDQHGQPLKIKATGFEVYLLDLYNPVVYDWVKSIIKENMINTGLSGWMADFGEWTPWNAFKSDKESVADLHNEYPVIWAQLNREAIEEVENSSELAFFSRSAYHESNKFASFYWAGDQNVNWQRKDGIASVVPALLSSGLSGMSINHADVGGFTTIKRFPIKISRSKNLLYRWTELSAFSPVFRSHEGLKPSINHQLYSDAKTAAFLRKMAGYRAILKPYLKYFREEAYKKGLPLVRHLLLHYPNDQEVLRLDQQYLLGKDILVFPVLKRGRKSVKGYFPEGEWIHLITKQKIKGKQWRKIDAPLGQPAVFINAKSSWANDILREFRAFTLKSSS